MTSQHFDDGWDNWGEDWGANFNNESNNNNNNTTHPSQPNQQYVQQPQLTTNAPIYSPFSYQQAAQQNPPTQQQNPFSKTPNQPQTSQQQQPYANPVNFFNPTQYSDANSINNNMNPYGSNQPSSYSFVQSPIPTSTITTSLNNPQNTQFEKVKNFQDVPRRDSSVPNNTNQNQVQYGVVPPIPVNNSLPPPSSMSNVNFSNDQNSALPIQQQQTMYNNHNLNQQPRSLATPPTLMQNYDTNFNNSTASQGYSQYSSQWNDQRTQSNESANNVSNWQSNSQPSATTSQNPYMINNNNNNNQQMASTSSNNSEWQNLQAPPISQSATVSSNSQINPPPAVLPGHQQMPPSNTGYFQGHFEAPPPIIEERPILQEVPKSNISHPIQTSTPNQVYQPQQTSSKFENIENIQTPISEPLAVPQLPPSSIPMVNTQPPKNPVNEVPYPENRERLDDLFPQTIQQPAAPQHSIPQQAPILLPPVSQPLMPSMPIPTSAPSIDRHNYLVTGQLSQEFPAFNNNNNNNNNSSSNPQQNIIHENFNENLPPPGLSRMVVGEPENNQVQQAQHIDLLPPRSNRMVTGNEMTPASFMNYQRQADGEVSQEPSLQRTLPPFSSTNQQQQQQLPQNQQHSVEESQQNFNISDRNLYLVAGESDANSQRVITGVESDNAPINLLNPLQNLHIEDDEDFVNISVTTMSRNVDGDGMEEQQIQQALDNSQQREEEIEGANDNNADLNVNNVSNNAHQPQVIEVLPIPPALNEQHSDIREDIEGGNDSSDAPQPQNVDFEEKRKSIDSGMRSQQKQNVTLSSEDSELRELEKNMKSKARRSKKYESNDSESASVDEYKEKSRDRYDDRYSKKNRDRIRDEYDKYKKKERERRSGGRSRRNDDTDGSRYDRRRTDDEDDDRKRNRNRSKKEDDDEGDEKERERKERRNRDPRDPRRKDYEYDDRRRDRRRREKYYDEEVYPSGRRSHNTSDREYDREYRPGRNSRGPYEMQGYYQQPSYPYDHNYYYQQQYSDKLNNWLEQIRLTNPQAYEWYKNYYSGILQKPQIPTQPTMDDIGGSLRSGYNSSSERASTSRFISGGIVTNPLRSLNTSFIDNTNEYQSLQQPYQAIGKDFNQSYSSLNYNNYDMYGDSRAKTTEETAASRMTPQKFQCLHGFVRLTNGLMITVDTFNTDDKYSVRIENVPIFDKTRKLYQSYPGPLIRGVSHKKTVIEFCEEKLKNNLLLESSLRSSYALLWSYLILMIRQNGSYTEHDIAELLMKNYEEHRSFEVDDNKSSTNNNNSNNDDDENATDVSESDENVTSEHNSNSASHSNQVTQSSSGSVLTENVVLDKFKNYLLYGNLHDALDYATDNNLWGHALFLASKVDRRQHANVMLKFANKLSYNDPLQTLYQIMSGRMPACVTNFDDKWGDWRPHLAMIISNCTDKPELVKRSILALGDTLASRGDFYGSQFCYLLIDPQFTDYSDTEMSHGKIALLGTTVQKSFNEFATNDSIIMTEVYEYARSLSAENYFISSLQKYKFLLATNLLDYGLKLKCLLYMEQISKCIILQPELFESSFISKVYSLADRLKFYDPVMEKLYEDNAEGAEDQKWLQDLGLVLQNQGSFVSEQFVPPAIQTFPSNDVYNPMDYQQTQQPAVQQIYDPVSQHQTPTHVPTIPSQTYEEHDSNQHYNNSNNYEQQNQVPVQSYDQNTAFNQYTMQQQDQQQMQNYSYGQNMSNENQNMIQNNEQQPIQQQNYMQPNFDQNSQYQQNDYGYGWEQPKPNITMGTAISHKYDEGGNQDQQKIEGKSEEEKKSPAKKPEADKSKKPAQANSSGWFSSLFRLGKAPNQMILPDDKNPSIVWDENTKKWVNKDEDPTEAESFKPPPKMGEMGMPVQNIPQSMPQSQPILQQSQQSIQQQPIQNIQQQPMQSMPQQPVPNIQQPQFMPQTQQQAMPQPQMMNQNSMQNHVAPMQQTQQQVNQNIGEEAAPSIPSAPNMFKMQKGRNLKKSYVDILGNAGKTVSQPKDLAPQMDMQFFNPTAQPQGMQFYNPNDFQ